MYSIITFNEWVCNNSNNNNFKVKITAHIDDEQNIWFKGKQVAEILRDVDTNQAIRKHVYSEDKRKWTR